MQSVETKINQEPHIQSYKDLCYTSVDNIVSDELLRVKEYLMMSWFSIK